MKVAEREQTHFIGQALADILAEQDSFVAGMRYHSLVDEVREAYVVREDLYAEIPPSKFATQALKVYEDEVLYPKVTDWKEVGEYLGEVLSEEVNCGVKADQVGLWHSLVKSYFGQPPTDASRRAFVFGLGGSEEVATEINSLVEQLRKSGRAERAILGAYESWASLITRGVTNLPA